VELSSAVNCRARWTAEAMRSLIGTRQFGAVHPVHRNGHVAPGDRYGRGCTSQWAHPRHRLHAGRRLSADQHQVLTEQVQRD
jgi:hypothetical protein